MNKDFKLIGRRKNALRLTVGIVILVSIILSCQKERNISLNEQSNSANSLLRSGRVNGITSRNGHLVFSSREEFENTLNWLSTAQENEKDVWESNFSGFQSMRSRFNQIVDAEKVIAQRYENMSETEYASMDPNVVEHASITLANMSMLRTDYTDGIGFFDKNIHYEPLADMVDSKRTCCS